MDAFLGLAPPPRKAPARAGGGGGGGRGGGAPRGGGSGVDAAMAGWLGGGAVKGAADGAAPPRVVRLEEVEAAGAAAAAAEAAAAAAAAKRPPAKTGLEGVLGAIRGEKAPSVLARTREAWGEFKEGDAEVTEELDAYKKDKNRYTDKVAFLERTDRREWEADMARKSRR